MTTSPISDSLIRVGWSSTGTSIQMGGATAVRSWTGATSIEARSTLSTCACGILWPPAKAPPLAPRARAMAEMASAERTARVMGASLIVRLRLVFADPLTFRILLI